MGPQEILPFRNWKSEMKHGGLLKPRNKVHIKEFTTHTKPIHHQTQQY